MRSGRPALEAGKGRMFFALWPDDAARAALAGLAAGVAAASGGRAPATANLHLTLAFIGDVAADRAEALREVARDVAAEIAPFTLALDRLGAFREGGIAWIGTAEVPPELAKMALRLARGLAAAGFRTERRAYAPHLTLARKCRTLPIPARTERVTWRVAELALVESSPQRGGSVYRDDSRWPLAGGFAAGRS